MGDGTDTLIQKFIGLEFFKLCASGNDFIVIFNFDGKISPEEGSFLARKLCRNKFSVSADGLILLEKAHSEKASFAWRFFNSDGGEAEMCGNGARCVSRLVVEKGLFKSPFYFETKAGLIYSEVKGKRVKVALTDPKDLHLNFVIRTEYEWFMAHFVNTGVPHVVIFWENLDNLPIEEIAPEIRYHEMFAPAGTNVNFVSIVRDGPRAYLRIRTYERGVEAETLACGTGSAAAAYISYKLGLLSSPIEVLTKGGEILKVYIEGREEKLFLEGDTLFVFEGKIKEDALK